MQYHVTICVLQRDMNVEAIPPIGVLVKKCTDVDYFI